MQAVILGLVDRKSKDHGVDDGLCVFFFRFYKVRFLGQEI
jgi:hypothetical protein